MPTLTVAIPTFEYLPGLKRILEALYPYRKLNEIEILIQDDSRSLEVKNYVQTLYSDFVNLNYEHNSTNVGAVCNWNKLLVKATGTYMLLMHHDEFPLKLDFIKEVLTHIKSSPKVDVFILNCYLQYNFPSIFRAHFPLYITEKILTKNVDYLLKRNMIGPLSCMIFRTKLLPYFDDKLSWFVDVDAMYTLLRRCENFKVLHKIRIGSEHRRSNSITASIRLTLEEIRWNERRYLTTKYLDHNAWVDTPKYPLLHIAENILWIVLRLFTIPFSFRIIKRNY